MLLTAVYGLTPEQIGQMDGPQTRAYLDNWEYALSIKRLGVWPPQKP